MRFIIDQVIHQATRKYGEQVGAVVKPYNGFFEHLLKPATFKKYCIDQTQLYNWKAYWDSNTSFIDAYNLVPDHVNIDFMLINDPVQHSDELRKLQQYYHLPVVLCLHETTGAVNPSLRQAVFNVFSKEVNKNAYIVFPTERLKKEWGLSDELFNIEVIPYGIPLSDQANFEDTGVSTLNDKTEEQSFLQESGELWKKKESVLKNKSNLVSVFSDREEPYVQTFLQEITQVIPYSKVYGFNGLVDAYKTFDEMIEIFQNSRVCVLNIEGDVPPFYAFIAAACKCAIIVNNTRWVNHVFADGKSCLTYNGNDVEAIRQAVQKLEDASLWDSMTQEAFNIIKSEFNQDDSTRKWVEFISKIIKRIYVL